MCFYSVNCIYLHPILKTKTSSEMRDKKFLSLLIAGIFALVSFASYANEATPGEAHQGGAVDTPGEISQMIDHHLSDSHYFVLFEDGTAEEHFGFPLPVILIDNGLKVFSAARFDHGHKLVEIEGQHYKLHHSKIYKTDAQGTIHYDENGFAANERPLDLSITKNVMVIILMAIFIFILFRAIASSYKKHGHLPKGVNRLMEPMVLFVRDDIAKTNIGPKYKNYTSWLLTIFFFVLFLNLFGMLPFGVNVTGNITITFALAMVTFFITQFSGNKNYWKHIFWMPGVPWPMKIILAPIEVLGMFTKPFALMIRLFANMTAGHVVLMSLLGLIVVYQNWIAGPAFFGFSLFIGVIEILVAFLQAYIFTLLSALYIGMAVDDHADHPQDDSDNIPVV